MRLNRRILALERQAAARPVPCPGEDPWQRRWSAFLALVPEDLRAAVASRLGGPYSSDSESYSSWALWPFARWAGEPPAGYRFPRSLVEWVLNPPRRFWMGHHCGRCGLTVPLYFTWSNDPNPPPRVQPFPHCPACGGLTSHAAHYRPDPEGPP